MEIADDLVAWSKGIAAGQHRHRLGGIVDEGDIGGRTAEQTAGIFVQPGQDMKMVTQPDHPAVGEIAGKIADGPGCPPVERGDGAVAEKDGFIPHGEKVCRTSQHVVRLARLPALNFSPP